MLNYISDFLNHVGLPPVLMEFLFYCKTLENDQHTGLTLGASLCPSFSTLFDHTLFPLTLTALLPLWAPGLSARLVPPITLARTFWHSKIPPPPTLLGHFFLLLCCTTNYLFHQILSMACWVSMFMMRSRKIKQSMSAFKSSKQFYMK